MISDKIVDFIFEIFEGKFIVGDYEWGHDGIEEEVTSNCSLIDPLTIKFFNVSEYYPCEV